MKKIGSVIFCALSICLIALAGNALAYNAAYTHTTYYTASVFPTINGQYTMGDEWLASGTTTFGTNGIFRSEWGMPANVFQYLLVETADNTDDAGDYFELCFDGNADGGTAPQTDDYRVTVTGHGASQVVQWYAGNGMAWVAIPARANTPLATSLSSSPKIAAAHYILELAIDKQGTDVPLGMNWALRVAYNDAHAGGAGLQAWPPAPGATRDAPAGWGYVPYEFAANPTPDVPEGISLGIMAALSSIALVAATVYLKKRDKA